MLLFKNKQLSFENRFAEFVTDLTLEVEIEKEAIGHNHVDKKEWVAVVKMNN
jgi:hypothetical protein